MFLDEPTAGVDPLARRAFWDVIGALADAGTSVFVTTHYLDEAEYCHRVGLIYRGRLIAQGSPTLRSWEFLGGKLLPYAALAFGEMLLLGVGRLAFGVSVRGSVPLLLALAALYVLATVGIGLSVSMATRSQVVAILLSLVLTLMPSFLFSGFLFRIESMPAFFQGDTHVYPARLFMEISRGSRSPPR